MDHCSLNWERAEVSFGCCRLRHKEKDVVRTEMSKAQNIGVDVTEFAQHVFNGLNKTYVSCCFFLA